MPDPKNRYPRKLRVVSDGKFSADDTQKPATGPLSFIEARRKCHVDKVYDVLIQELYEEGCVNSAIYFRCLVDAESELYLNGSIRDRVRDDMDLLMALYENTLNAEKAAFFQNCAGLATSYRLLYQIIVLLEQNSNQYEWLIEKSYQIIVRIVDKTVPSRDSKRPTEMEARIYLKYGMYLGNIGENLKTAIFYLKKAMELSRGQLWFEDFSMYATASVNIKHRPLRTLSTVASYFLAKKSLNYAKQVSRQNPRYAAELAQKATKIIAEIGIGSNERIFCETCIASATYLMDSKLFGKALKMLSTFENFLPNVDLGADEKLLMLKCELLIVRGTCLSNLNQMREAKTEHQRAIKIATTNGFTYHEAEAQLSIGKFYVKNNQSLQAKNALQMAKKLFIKDRDKKSAKKTLYLLAKIQADELFPFFLDLMKDDCKCGLYKLREWKTQCKPFWEDMHKYQGGENLDDIYCLLTQKKERRSTNLTVQAPQVISMTSFYRHRKTKFLVLEDRFL